MRFSICLLVLLVAACSQDSGETCQKQSDCADGLICDIAPRAERGVCRKEEEVDLDMDQTVEEDPPVPGNGDDAGHDDDGG